MIVYKGTNTLQINTLHWVLASGLIRDLSVAVDGGANVGEWSEVMARWFKTVHAFEPGGMFRATAPNIVLHERALLDRVCRATLNTKGKDRGWSVRADKRGQLRATTIDALRLKSCGFIKLDLEGADGLAVLGGLKTLKRFGPVVMIEMGKQSRRCPGIRDEDIRTVLGGLGYQQAHRVESDFIFARNDGL